MKSATLIPVLEFDPFEYRSDRRSPERSIEDAPDEWAHFWRDSLADRGVTGLAPLDGTWVVPVEDVDSAELLEHVLVLHFGEDSLVEYFRTLAGPFDPASAMNAEGELIFDGVTPLRGGIALANEVGRITPECCGDLSNWREWQNATRATSEQWLKIWLGHPEARVRARGDELVVQKLLETGDPTGDMIPVDARELIAATERVRGELRVLEKRLCPVLEPALLAAEITPEGEDVGPLARRFAEHLAGLSEFTLD